MSAIICRSKKGQLVLVILQATRSEVGWRTTFSIFNYNLLLQSATNYKVLSYVPVYVHVVSETGRQNSSSVALNSVIIWYGRTKQQQQLVGIFFWKINRKKPLRDTLTFREKMTFPPQILNDEQIPFLSILIYLNFKSSRFTPRFVFFFCLLSFPNVH